MSVHRTPIAFFGRFFFDQGQAVDFLKKHRAKHDTDMFDSDTPHALALELQNDCSYALGFILQVGTSDIVLRSLWQHRMGHYDSEAASHMFVR